MTQSGAGTSRDWHVFGSRVVVGTGGRVLSDTVVTIRGNTVTRVGPPLPGMQPLGGEVYQTVLPGLVDSHVHIGFGTERGFDVPAPEAALGCAAQQAGITLRNLLRHGVTTVRDLGCPGPLFVRVRQELARAPLAAPRLFGSSAPITTPGGHLAVIGHPVSSAGEAHAADFRRGPVEIHEPEYRAKLLDNLRAGTPKHLYLPGPHRGVFNREGLEGQPEIILCEALIDALTFWSAGYRNVTSCYGVNGITDEIVDALKSCGAQRILIAFDRDEAGDRGAEALSKRLTAEGLDCFRLLFPKGMDANAYACAVKPAEKSLGVVIRSAEWMGQGAKPALGHAVKGADVSAMNLRPDASLTDCADPV